MEKELFETVGQISVYLAGLACTGLLFWRAFVDLKRILKDKKHFKD